MNFCACSASSMPADDAREERVLDVGNDDADGARGAGAQVAGDVVGTVVELADGVPDALGQLAADELRARQHARDGGRRDIGAFRDFVNGRRRGAPGFVRRAAAFGAAGKSGHARRGSGSRPRVNDCPHWVNCAATGGPVARIGRSGAARTPSGLSSNNLA